MSRAIHILCVTLVVALASAAFGATYYVSTTGNDSWPGTQAQPWATLQHAVDTIAAGDTILVLPGTYAGCKATLSGASGAPKTLMAQTAGTVLVNTPSPISSRLSGIEIQNTDGTTPVNYWVVDGFEITSIPRYGIDARAANYLTVRNCTAHNNGATYGATGIYSSRGNYVLIENNTSYSNAEHGFYVCNSADNGTVRANVSYSNTSLGFHMNGDVTMGGDGIMSGWLLEKNKSYNNGSSAFDADGVETSTWRNNLGWGNPGKGVQVTGVDGAITSRNNRILNNTLLLPTAGYYVINIRVASRKKPAPVGNKIFNNILYHYSTATNRGSICIAASGYPNFESNYNVVMQYFGEDDNKKIYTFAQWRAKGYDLNSIQAADTALFVNPSGNDYHLKSTSPAKDAGTTLSDVTDDLEGVSRPQGTAYDIGCYEYH